MCAIIDANVVAEVFGSSRPPAEAKFFDWLHDGKTILVVGGRLLRELSDASNNFTRWAQVVQHSKHMRIVDDAKVNDKTKQLLADRSCKSDDEHIIALAQLGGARLLYSNDGDLHQDFDDKSLIDSPRGKVYSTLRNKNFTRRHRDLLRRRDLCGTPQ